MAFAFLRLMQGETGSADYKYVNVALLFQPGALSALYDKYGNGSAVEKVAWVFDHVSEYPILGRWRLGSNSVTGNPNENYLPGTSAGREYQFWRYSQARQQVLFTEYTVWTGDNNPGGPFDVNDVVQLYDAVIGKGGLIPAAGPTEEGKGFFDPRGSDAKRADPIGNGRHWKTPLFETGPLRWERVWSDYLE